MMRVTNETKAELKAETGRVVGFVKSNEPGRISLAVPADRAVLTPGQARELAEWLIEESHKGARVSASARTDSGWRTAEAQRQAEIRAALDKDRVTFDGRTYTRAR
ncbi:hypothetical protein ACIRO1_36480 [Streptomyces sp. NPDC102381]|uniref:hypothetical protein n=1 Tax=Streptomyces sp. NPDC102381 TaxID=3366164 RepID=UPI003826011A